MKPSSPSMSGAHRDAGTSENVGARNPSTGRCRRDPRAAPCPRGLATRNCLGRELGERIVPPAVQRDLVAPLGDVADQLGVALGELAHDEERCRATPSGSRKLEHAAGGRGVRATGGRGGRSWSSRSRVKVIGAGDISTRPCRGTRRCRAAARPGRRSSRRRRMRYSGDGCRRRGGCMPRTHHVRLQPA